MSFPPAASTRESTSLSISRLLAFGHVKWCVVTNLLRSPFLYLSKHDGEVDEDCVSPPNVLNLDELAERGRAREERTRSRGQPALPPIHVHVGASGDAGTLHDVDTNVPSRKRARAILSDSESDSDSDGESLPIDDVLSELNKKFPALDYPQYATALKAKGIAYASSVVGLGASYYKENIGMVDGAIEPFIKRTRKMVKAAKKRNGKKRARSGGDDDKENA